jgi:hypothetical protein
MLIKVQYQDGTFGQIEAYLLDDLIKSRKIKKFRRSGKWVIIGVDPTREFRDDIFEMPKREQSEQEKEKKK